MGFWNRLLGLSGAEQIVDSRATGTATPRRRLSGDSDATVDLGCDPREAAQVLYVALDRAADLGMVPDEEITVDDIDFDFYGGVDGFRTEAMTALLRLDDDEARPSSPGSSSSIPSASSPTTRMHTSWSRSPGPPAPATASPASTATSTSAPTSPTTPSASCPTSAPANPSTSTSPSKSDWIDPEVARQLFEDATPEGHRWVATGDYAIHTWVEDRHADALARIFADEDAAAETRLVGGLRHHRHAGTDHDTRG
ncbi:hypothetical protein QP028_12690 [Corynebacterium suedekumii]|nr:hypothetical protein QP028_12690 [Corynebacterium suedekumii]